MSWLMHWFGRDDEDEAVPRPSPPISHAMDLERACCSAEKMLVTLEEAYGPESVLVRQQRAYLDTLRRELSAARAA